MATAHVTTTSIISALLSRLPAAASWKAPACSTYTAVHSRQIIQPLFPSLAFTIPSIQLNVPGFLEGLWESVLRAVPKKKTSHMKKRHRQMAGKGMKDITSLTKCPGCGAVKRAHMLCPICVSSIQGMYRGMLRQFRTETPRKRYFSENVEESAKKDNAAAVVDQANSFFRTPKPKKS